MLPVMDEKSSTFPSAYGSNSPSKAAHFAAGISDQNANLSTSAAKQTTGPVAENYGKLFRTVAADTPELMEEVYRLRYQVYCVENQFLDPSHYPDGLEKDCFDAHSKHVLLIHRKSGAAAGTARIVLPRLGDVSGPMPLYSICSEILDCVPVHSTVETSRFAISKDFRRRLLDGSYGQFLDAEDMALDPRRVIPHISLGLLAASVQLTLVNNCDYVCGVMEPTLLRLLTRFGMEFRPVGPVIDHHGLRQPCYAKMDELMARIEVKSPDLWEMITDNGRHAARSIQGAISNAH